MCNKTNWKLKCGRVIRPSMINLWRMLKMLIEVKCVGAESNKSVDKTECSAQELLDRWRYCYHVSDTMSCWTQHVPLCFILHAGAWNFGALSRRAVVRSLLCVCVYTISTLYTNLVYWDSLRGDFMVKYTHAHILLVLSFKFDSLHMNLTCLDRNIYGTPW